MAEEKPWWKTLLETQTAYLLGKEAYDKLQELEIPDKALNAIKDLLLTLPGVIWDGFLYRILIPLGDLLTVWWPKVGEAEDQGWDMLLNWIETAGLMSKSQAENLMRFRGLPPLVQSFFNIILIGSFLGIYMKNVAEVSTADTVQKLQAQFTPNLPDPATLIQSAFIAPEKTEGIRKILQRLGYKDDHIDLMFIANYRLYDVLTVRDLFLRKEIDEFLVYERLNEMGFTNTRIAEMMKIWNVIPPITDILTMVAKEAFEPDMIQRYGLSSEFPEEQSSWLEKQGLSRYWQEKYWAAHWDYPSPGQVLTMLHRGLIEEKDVYEYYKVVEMPPYWRDLLMQTSFNPYTRVDLRRMHAMGVVSDEELVKNYMDQGYDQEHAEKMAEFTIAYNADAMKKLTQSQVIKAYRNKLLSPEEVHALLEPLKFRSEHIDFLLAMEDFDETIEIQGIYQRVIHDKYVNNLIDDVQLNNELGKLNLPGRQMTALIEKWQTEKLIGVRLPSKTDLDKFLRNEIITKDEYRLEMYKLGYSWNYVNWYSRLVDLKKAG